MGLGGGMKQTTERTCSKRAIVLGSMHTWLSDVTAQMPPCPSAPGASRAPSLMERLGPADFGFVSL